MSKRTQQDRCDAIHWKLGALIYDIAALQNGVESKEAHQALEDFKGNLDQSREQIRKIRNIIGATN